MWISFSFFLSFSHFFFFFNFKHNWYWNGIRRVTTAVWINSKWMNQRFGLFSLHGPNFSKMEADYQWRKTYPETTSSRTWINGFVQLWLKLLQMKLGRFLLNNGTIDIHANLRIYYIRISLLIWMNIISCIVDVWICMMNRRLTGMVISSFSPNSIPRVLMKTLTNGIITYKWGDLQCNSWGGDAVFT